MNRYFGIQDGKIVNTKYRWQYAYNEVGNNHQYRSSPYLNYSPQNQNLKKRQLMIDQRTANTSHQNFPASNQNSSLVSQFSHLLVEYVNVNITTLILWVLGYILPWRNSNFPDAQLSSGSINLWTLPYSNPLENKIGNLRELDTNNLGKIDSDELEVTDNLGKTQNDCMRSVNTLKDEHSKNIFEDSEFFKQQVSLFSINVSNSHELIKMKLTTEPSLSNGENITGHDFKEDGDEKAVSPNGYCSTDNIFENESTENGVLEKNISECKLFEVSSYQLFPHCLDTKSTSTGLSHELLFLDNGSLDNQVPNKSLCQRLNNTCFVRNDKISFCEKLSYSSPLLCLESDYNVLSNYVSPFFLHENVLIQDLLVNVSLAQDVSSEKPEVKDNYFEDAEFCHNAKWIQELVEV